MQLEISDLPKEFFSISNFCISKVIDKEIPTNADRVFLMEVMKKIAICHDDTNFDSSGAILTLDHREGLALWHCIRICLDNKFIRNDMKKNLASSSLFKLASYLDTAEEVKKEIKVSNEL